MFGLVLHSKLWTEMLTWQTTSHQHASLIRCWRGINKMQKRKKKKKRSQIKKTKQWWKAEGEEWSWKVVAGWWGGANQPPLTRVCWPLSKSESAAEGGTSLAYLISTQFIVKLRHNLDFSSNSHELLVVESQSRRLRGGLWLEGGWNFAAEWLAPLLPFRHCLRKTPYIAWYCLRWHWKCTRKFYGSEL